MQNQNQPKKLTLAQQTLTNLTSQKTSFGTVVECGIQTSAASGCRPTAVK
ncbi:MAG TPA: hypothetical protein VHA33_15945 [Candidatus Angelobacter sp.]|jgi:hypothetical protein|nr:hypothetical protein [Candidatus Angelobacter sp.]